MLILFVAGLLTAAPAAPLPRVEEIRDRRLGNLLNGIEMALDLGTTGTFSLRAFRDVRPGECDPAKPCTKDRLIVVVSTFDEYPEAKAFEIPIVGELRGIDVVEAPEREDGAYRLVMRSSPTPDGRITCTSLDVTLTSIRAEVVPCGQSGTKSAP